MKKVFFGGFTLIELMITVAIVAILASIAYPSYIEYVTRSGRSEGVAAVMRVANLQEQYYMDNRVFAEDMSELGLSKPSEPFETESGYYSVESVGTTSYTITATAAGSQASRDKTCKKITLTSVGDKGAINSADVKVAFEECWK